MAFSRSHPLPALVVAALLLTACGGSDDREPAAHGPSDVSVGSLNLIARTVLPRRGEFQGTVVGGLSGIDHDPRTGEFVLLTDDRTATDSPHSTRVYTATLATASSGSASSGSVTVAFQSVVTLRQPDGSVYPKVPDRLAVDPESIRIDHRSGNWLWVSEGERTLTSTPPRVIDPFIREVKPDGSAVREYELPAMFRMNGSAEVGPRGNAAFEGAAFTPDGDRLVTLMEGALFQDADAPTTSRGSVSRLTVFDRASGRALAQYAYPIDPVQAPPAPAGAFTVNGPTELLATSATTFLVLERSFSVGMVGNQVRLYEVDLAGATDVLPLSALRDATYRPVSKRLVQDFEAIKATAGGIANLEGMSFGPRLPNGHPTLVVVADDNFPTADSPTDVNQVLVFEVLPKR